MSSFNANMASANQTLPLEYQLNTTSASIPTSNYIQPAYSHGFNGVYTQSTNPPGAVGGGFGGHVWTDSER